MSRVAPLAAASLRRRLGSLLLAVGLTLALLLSAAIVLLLALRSSQDRIVHDYFAAITSSNQGLLTLVDTETAIRGYAITHDAVSLQPGRAFLSHGVRLDTPAARRLLHDDPGLVALLARTQGDADRWVGQWAVPTTDAVRRGATITGPDVLRGKQLFDAIRADIATYTQALDRRRDHAYAVLSLQTSLLFATVLATVLVTGLLGAAVLVVLRRWVVDPLEHLGSETRFVRDGDLHRNVAVTGPPEIQALARDIDLMRIGLITQIEQVRRTGKEVEAARALLESQAEDLRRSNRDLEQFAYVASHDLQEPLRKVASFCQLLQKRYGGQLDERADQYIGFAVDGAKRMQQLINDLLAFSRVGRVSAGTTQVPLEECMGAALRNLELALQEAGATVTHDPLPVVPGERTLLTQLLQNLLGNAIKFRRPGVAPVVHLEVRELGDHWEFACADNGIGIEGQYAERVFVIFQRLHAKDEYDGTGIGLALCRKIVEFHGGSIWIEPSSGTGATIRWTLPYRTGRDAGPAALDEGET